MNVNGLRRASALIAGGAVGLLVLFPAARRLLRSLRQNRPAETDERILTRHGFEMDSGIRKAQMGTPAQKPTEIIDQ